MSNIERRRLAHLGIDNLVSQVLIEQFPHLGYIAAPHDPAATCFQDMEIGGAIACTAQEGFLLNRLVHFGDFNRMLEIGSYIGWSTAHLLYGNQKRITCVDPFIEAPGRLLPQPDLRVKRRFYENMDRLGMSERIYLFTEPSPAILSEIAPDHGWDFVFLDGWHLNGQPERDVRGFLPLLAEEAVVVFHDTWMHDVYEGVKVLMSEGWTYTYSFHTANAMGVCWREEPTWWKAFLEEIGS